VAPASADVGLYVHVAFCQTKCYYCDFNTYAGLGRLIAPYVAALGQEIRALPPAVPLAGADQPFDLAADQSATRPDFRIGSIFFGGGTPSLLTPAQLEDILDAARRWPWAESVEITLEINPDDPTPEYLRDLRGLGVNRLSFGVQSFDDARLRRLGRRHGAAAAVRAYQEARAAGFDNLSLDLMFALPEQSLAQWEGTLDQATALAPDHLSLYNLTVEPETPFGAWAAAGKLVVPDDDAAADMYQAAFDRLGAAGYGHYEISNWARSDPHRDLRAQHNLRYWRNQPYFGVGAGAHSSFGGYRYANRRPPLDYLQRIRAGQTAVDPETVEAIGRDLAMAETMLLGLRLAEGVQPGDFQQRFGCPPAAVYGPILSQLANDGLIEVSPDRITLTHRGRFLGNEVFCRFLS
jgi:oxygen-independent coproporphyrinogen-3 oxidase